MRTIILKHSDIELAARILRKGGLVAFPTETVYGLGADALNPRAIRKIFNVKRRPMDNPLIVHVANREDVYRLTKEVPKEAERLMKKFWPGPLTLIMKKSRSVPRITTGNLDTIAIRMPANKPALTLIKKAGVPVAAPSANISGSPSPTTVEHVIDDLYGKINAIISGGKTRFGLESTVVDVSVKPPVLMRPGAITVEQLKAVLGEIKLHPSVKGRTRVRSAKAPGMKYRHYAPRTKLILVEGRDRCSKIQRLIAEYKKKGKKVGILAASKRKYKADRVKFLGLDLSTVAKELFKALRELDKKGLDIIIAEGVYERGVGIAIMNRLRKAANRIVKS